jgi:hypothetical protein
MIQRTLKQLYTYFTITALLPDVLTTSLRIAWVTRQTGFGNTVFCLNSLFCRQYPPDLHSCVLQAGVQAALLAATWWRRLVRAPRTAYLLWHAPSRGSCTSCITCSTSARDHRFEITCVLLSRLVKPFSGSCWSIMAAVCRFGSENILLFVSSVTLISCWYRFTLT